MTLDPMRVSCPCCGAPENVPCVMPRDLPGQSFLLEADALPIHDDRRERDRRERTRFPLFFTTNTET